MNEIYLHLNQSSQFVFVYFFCQFSLNEVHYSQCRMYSSFFYFLPILVERSVSIFSVVSIPLFSISCQFSSNKAYLSSVSYLFAFVYISCQFSLNEAYLQCRIYSSGSQRVQIYYLSHVSYQGWMLQKEERVKSEERRGKGIGVGRSRRVGPRPGIPRGA